MLEGFFSQKLILAIFIGLSVALGLAFPTDRGKPQSLFQSPPPSFTIGVTIDQAGSFNGPTGVATISGTVTCSRAVSVFFFGFLRQKVGRLKNVEGNFSPSVNCSGVTSWSATVVPYTGAFAGGAAFASASAFAFDPGTGQSASAQTSTTVKLKGGPK